MTNVGLRGHEFNAQKAYQFDLDFGDFAAPDSPGDPSMSGVLYTLQPGDWILDARIVVTEAFNDASAGASGASVRPEPGLGGTIFNTAGVLIDQVQPSDDGLYGADGQGPQASSVHVAVTPLDTAVDVVVGLAAWTGDGTTGAMRVLLLVAEF